MIISDKSEGENIQEKQTACPGVYVKYTDILVGLEPCQKQSEDIFFLTQSFYQ